MGENKLSEKNAGIKIMDLLVMLLEDQTGKHYEYREIETQKEKTA